MGDIESEDRLACFVLGVQDTLKAWSMVRERLGGRVLELTPHEFDELLRMALLDIDRDRMARHLRRHSKKGKSTIFAWKEGQDVFRFVSYQAEPMPKVTILQDVPPEDWPQWLEEYRSPAFADNLSEPKNFHWQSGDSVFQSSGN